ncbi:MAG: hypothetical protein ACW99G_14780 [Candidatus Thorarchaeota archaeon]|jgi:hypothetical protein
MSLCLRVDDFPGTKPAEFDNHNLENYKRFHHTLIQCKVQKYVLGVIPGYTTMAHLTWLNDQTEIVVALHGVVHNESNQDEFRDMTYRDIETAIHRAKDFLEATLDYRVVDYIPPHNTINGDTVLALSRLGFERIYGGPETAEEMKGFIRLEGMEYIHSEPPLEYGRSDELVERGSVEYLTKNCQNRDIYLTLHWPWEHNIGLKNLSNYLYQVEDEF